LSAATTALMIFVQSYLIAASDTILLVVCQFVLIVVLPVWYSMSQARRLHDLGWSAWLLVLHLVPFVGTLGLAIVCLFLKGQDGANQYGIDPRLLSEEVPPRVTTAI
jgi:uncharacterized membrane protein YhaH (DUF805 family)